MGKLAAYEKQMLASPDQQISLTDPDSRSMATSGRGSGVVGYNVQVAVDTEHHLIVTHEVTNTARIARSWRTWPSRRRPFCDGRRSKPSPTAATSTARDPRVRRGRHHGDAAEADDIGREGGGAVRQAGLCLSARGGCLSLPGRRASEVPYSNEEDGKSCVAIGRRRARLAAQIAMHDRAGAAHHALGARACARGRAEAARREPAGHASAARDGRASLRHASRRGWARRTS